MSSVESRIFLWGGVAVGGSGLLWIVPGINAVFSVGAIAALVLIVSRLGYLRALWAALGGLIMVMATTTFAMGEAVGMLNAAVFAIAVLAPGFMMGMASRGLFSAVKTIWYGSIPILILFGLLLTFYSTLISSVPSITRQVNTIMETSLDQSPVASKMLIDKYGAEGGKEKFLADLDQYIVFFIKVIPGTIVIGFLTIIIISLYAGGKYRYEDKPDDSSAAAVLSLACQRLVADTYRPWTGPDYFRHERFLALFWHKYSGRNRQCLRHSRVGSGGGFYAAPGNPDAIAGGILFGFVFHVFCGSALAGNPGIGRQQISLPARNSGRKR